MYDHYPFDCTDDHIDADSPFAEPLGLCVCCESYCFADEGALELANGVLCAKCLNSLPQESLADYIGAIAPVTWTDADIARVLSSLR